MEEVNQMKNGLTPPVCVSTITCHLSMVKQQERKVAFLIMKEGVTPDCLAVTNVPP